jgi:hypothetical protein
MSGEPPQLPIAPPTLDALEDAIGQLRATDLRTANIDDFKAQLVVLFTGWWLTTPVFAPGLALCRGRSMAEPPAALRNMSYPPAQVMTADGRASRRGVPLFYASAARAPVFFETRASVGMKLAIVHYETTADLTLMRIGYTPTVHASHGSTRELPEYGALDIDLYETRAHLVNDFLSEVFMAQMIDGEEWRYRLSIAVAEKLLDADMVEGILYPSAAMWANADNFALRPRFVDQHLTAVYAEFVQVTAVAGTSISIDVLDEARRFSPDGSIEWLGHPGTWQISTPRGELKMEAKDGYWIARDEQAVSSIRRELTAERRCTPEPGLDVLAPDARTGGGSPTLPHGLAPVDTVSAVAQAIFGLIGVVVGSLITWGVEVWRARRQDHDEGRVAARIVAAELQAIANVRTADEPQFRRERELALAQDAWITHRAALARELTDEGWRAVRMAYDALADVPRTTVGERHVDKNYEAAMDALRPLASSERRYWWQRLV